MNSMPNDRTVPSHVKSYGCKGAIFRFNLESGQVEPDLEAESSRDPSATWSRLLVQCRDPVQIGIKRENFRLERRFRFESKSAM